MFWVLSCPSTKGTLQGRAKVFFLSVVAMGGVNWVARFGMLLRRRVKIKAKRCHGKMNRSPILPGDENGSCSDLGYDPRDDFSEFLAEARRHANDTGFKPELLSTFSPKKIEAEHRKTKRSWKTSLSFFWWRFEKRGTVVQNTLAKRATLNRAGRTEIPNLRQGAVSGPISGGRSKQDSCPSGRPVSGPLSRCFTPTRVDDEEAKIPYMWLDQFNSPTTNQVFGPIYLVT